MNLVSLLGDSSTSTDRVPDSNIFSFANKKKKNDRIKVAVLEKSNETSEILSVNNPEINNDSNPITLNIKNEEEIDPLFKQIANDILISTIDSMNSAFIFSLISFLFFELCFPIWILLSVFLFLVVFQIIRNLNYFAQLRSEEEKESKIKILSQLCDLVFTMIIIVNLIKNSLITIIVILRLDYLFICNFKSSHCFI